MKKISSLKIMTICAVSFFMNAAYGQDIIYQQNFDGNNGNFSNSIISKTTATNGWIASNTDVQYGNYRHLWNFSDVATGGNTNVLPISGRSLGMGFFNGNNPNVPNQAFRTWDGEEPATNSFYTTRWAHVGVSTIGYEEITIEFKWKCLGEVDNSTIYDYGTVNTSIDNGATWLMDQTGGQGGKTSEHGTFNGGLYYGSGTTKTTTITLPSSRWNQAQFRLAFRMVVDEAAGTGGGFIIDDIIIKGKPMLATIEATKTKIETYRDNKDFVISSSSKNIKQLEVYDASGKLIKTVNKIAKEIRIPTEQIGKGMHLLKIKLENGEEHSKKITN